MDNSTLSRRDMLKRATAAGLVLPLSGGLLAACGDDDGATAGGPGLLQELQRTGIARIAIANEPPYTKVEPDGTVTGAEPEIARAVLERLEIGEVQGVVTPYEAMIPGLKARRWDMITAGLFMKRSRCAEILYSEPTVVSTESFAVEPGNPKGLETIADVKANPDVKVGVLPGAFEEGILEEAQVPGGQIVSVQDGRSGIEALNAGRVDAFFLPTLSLEALQEGEDFEVTPPIEDAPVTGAGHGFRKSDREFRNAYNKGLEAIQESGEFARILKPWGFSAEAAIEATAAELCKTEG
ncbi:MAG: ectoine/hydroxyectoine ABC transporter substrate-binding protein EhuB [Thermoleophilaceae bacterium]